MTMSKPDFSDFFPKVDPNLKINDDMDNRVHGPHYDVLQGIEGGVDQVRITPDGDVMGGTTRIGKTKADW